MAAVENILQDYVENIIQNPENTTLDINNLPEEFRTLGEKLLELSQNIIETNILAKEISKGNLNTPLPPPSNKMASPLKSLHASLKHLTWQTQQVARGDYHQIVDFMGDFSESFNIMTEQLEQRKLSLLGQIQAMSENRNIYEILVREINQHIVITLEDVSQYLYVSRDINPNDWESYRPWFEAHVQEAKKAKGKLVTESEAIVKGVLKHYSVSIYTLYWNNDNAYAFVFTDISHEKNQLKRLEEIAHIDTLTQLYNRRYGMEILSEWIKCGKKFALCFVDVNSLKYVNDSYGHMEGDDYIIAVSKKLREMDDDVIVCRIGRDEFMVIREDWDLDSATEKFEILNDALLITNNLYARSISYGIVLVDEANTHPCSDLLSLADEKMYAYKKTYKEKYNLKTRGCIK